MTLTEERTRWEVWQPRHSGSVPSLAYVFHGEMFDACIRFELVCDAPRNLDFFRHAGMLCGARGGDDGWVKGDARRADLTI